MVFVESMAFTSLLALCKNTARNIYKDMNLPILVFDISRLDIVQLFLTVDGRRLDERRRRLL